MECFSYYGIEKCTFRRKISDFGVDFHIYSLLFQRHFQSCLSYRPLTRNACTISYLIGNRVCNIFECCFILPKHNKLGGGGGGGVGNFHNSRHRMALGHVSGKSTCFFVRLRFDSLHHIKNLSVKQGRVFLG